jgi:tetratricopeptide (TPR) repeat protein
VLAASGLALLALALAPGARAAVAAGQTLEEVALARLGGGTEPLAARGAVNVVLFWRPGQEHSADTLRQMAQCGKAFAGKPVHMVAVVSGAFPPDEVKAAVLESSLQAPVLIDGGDQVYGRLEIRQHPLVVVADGKGKVALAQPYVRLRYCDIVHAHVRHLLQEIDAAQLEAALHPSRSSFPDDDRNNVARRYVNMGRRELEAGRCDRALASFGKALEIAPRDKDALAGVEACAADSKRQASAK